MSEFMTGALQRRVAVVNLDPANDQLPYACAVDVNELVRLETVMERFALGPNGGLLYCMEYLEKNLDWLQTRLQPLEERGDYVLFDCPGQVELYTHHSSMRNIVAALQRRNYRLTAVHLVDSMHCASPASYISVALLSLTTMLQLELPHVNVLSKFDLLRVNELDMPLEFYTDVQDLRYLRRHLDRELPKRFRALNKALCELIEDYGLVSFTPLDIQNKESVAKLLVQIDKSNGCTVFGAMTAAEPPRFPDH